MFNTKGLNAGDWIGVFGQSDSNNYNNQSNPLQTNFQFPSSGNSEPRNTNNAPLNDAFQFPTIGIPNLDRKSQFNRELDENQLAGQQATQNTIGGAEQLSRITSENYQKKLNADLWAEQQRNQINNSGARSSQVGGGGQQSLFGKWGTPTLVQGGLNDKFGNDFRRAAAREGLDFATQSARRITEAEAAGDIAKMRAQASINQGADLLKHNQSIDLMNRQTSLDSQRSANDFTRQASEAAKNRVSQERLAQIQANANIYGSMFGALSSPGANTRYWS